MHTTVRQTLETETNTRLEDYGDLIVQNLGTAFLVPSSDIGAGAVLPFDETVGEFDVLGDVDRYGADEAVLIAQKLRGLQVALEGSEEDPTNIEFEYTFGFESGHPTRELITDEIVSPNNEIVRTDEVNNDVLYYVSGTVHGRIEDSNGSSGSNDYQVTDETNYLHEVGVLPEVSARENLYEYFGASTTTGDEQITSQNIKLFTNWQLFWLETDEPLEGRQIDIVE